jgi:hypothetical protein
MDCPQSILNCLQCYDSRNAYVRLYASMCMLCYVRLRASMLGYMLQCLCSGYVRLCASMFMLF